MKVVIDSEKKAVLQLGDVLSIYVKYEGKFSEYLVCKSNEGYTLKSFDGRGAYATRETLSELSDVIAETNHKYFPSRLYDLVLKPKYE